MQHRFRIFLPWPEPQSIGIVAVCPCKAQSYEATPGHTGPVTPRRHLYPLDAAAARSFEQEHATWNVEVQIHFVIPLLPVVFRCVLPDFDEHRSLEVVLAGRHQVYESSAGTDEPP